MSEEQPPPTDEWFESEQPTRTGMIAELQRIKLRTKARPIPVILLGLLVTAALAYKIQTKQQIVEADVVLLLTDGALSKENQNGIPVLDLKNYVANALLPADKLLKLIDERQPGARKKLGDQGAIESLKEQYEVTVWKNSYMYYDEDAPNAEHSARIGIAVSDTDPDKAFQLARDLATIVRETADEQRRVSAQRLAAQTKAFLLGLQARNQLLIALRVQRLRELEDARKSGKLDVQTALQLKVQEIDGERLRNIRTIDSLATSRDLVADKIVDAKLDTTLTIVEEHKPERPVHKGFVLIMVLAVVGVGALFGSALFVGAFDSRIHDTDDIARLGLPVIGHVPSVKGDTLGSLRARGVRRGKIVKRWRQ